MGGLLLERHGAWGGLGRFAEDAQVATPCAFQPVAFKPCAFNLSGFEGNPGSALLGSLRELGQRGSFAHGVGKGQEVVRTGFRRRGRHGKPQDLPAAGNGQGTCMLGTEIIGVGFGIRRQWTEHCR